MHHALQWWQVDLLAMIGNTKRKARNDLKSLERKIKTEIGFIGKVKS
jgi:hypothetical protein